MVVVQALTTRIQREDKAAAIADVKDTGTGTKTITVNTKTITLAAKNIANHAAGNAVGQYRVSGYHVGRTTPTTKLADATAVYAGIYASTDGKVVKPFRAGTPSSADQIKKAENITGATVAGSTNGVVYYTGQYVSYDTKKTAGNRFAAAKPVGVRADFVNKNIDIKYNSPLFTESDQSGKIFANGVIEYRNTGSKGAYTGHGNFFSTGAAATGKAVVQYVAGSDTEGTLTRAFTAKATP